MKTKRKKTLVPRAPRRHSLATAAILISLVGAWGFGYFSLQKERTQVLEERAHKLEEFGIQTQQLFIAEQEKLDRLLVRIRSELRTNGHWSQQTPSAALRELRPEEQTPAPKEVAVQLGTDAAGERWGAVRADLRRGLSARADLLSLALVVADQAGLTSVRVRVTEDRVVEEMEDPRASKGVAKAIWYTEEVRRAVAANGRRAERGAFSSTGTGERASDQTILRVALALHDPSELVQGVIVATVEVSAIADTLISAADAEIQARLVMLDGRTLHTETARTPVSPANFGVERDAILASRVAAPDRTEKAFSVDNSLVDGLPLIHADGRNSDVILLMEMPLPPNDLISQATTPWGSGLIALTALSAIAVALLMRQKRRLLIPLDGEENTVGQTVDAQEEAAAPQLSVEPNVREEDAGSPPSADESALLLAREEMDLREWLGDVRGCLEREAATRGLSLNVKCERSLPQKIKQDPGWLGGLVIAMGQEALDATAEERVCVRVREDSHDVLRFEVDAGSIELSPLQGMLAVADKLGGHFESDPRQGLAFLVPLSAN